MKRDEKIASLETELASIKAKEVASARLAELEAIHPLDAATKTEEFVASLSSISEDRFESLRLRQELAKSHAAMKETVRASRENGGSVPFLSTYKPAEGAEKVSVLDVL